MGKPRISPRVWQPPRPERAVRPPSLLGDVRVIPVAGHGAEDVLVLPDGRVVTGLADGRILAITPDGKTQHELADTRGRPLGIELHPDGSLVVCDAHRGLLSVDPVTGVVDELVSRFEGVPLRFCNNAAVTPDGTIYFTDSSTKFGVADWHADLLEHGATGRLLRRDPDGEVGLVLDGLAFANGVALAADGSFVIVAETAAYALRRVWLSGPLAGSDEVFGPVLPGFPDNISTGDDGLIWITVASPRDRMLDLLLPRAPFLRRIVWALPESLQPQPQRTVRVQAYDDHGVLVHDLSGTHPEFHMVTGVRRSGDTVWLGSLEEPAIAALRAP